MIIKKENSKLNNIEYDSKRWFVLIILFLAIFVGPYSQYQLPPLAESLIPSLNISQIQFSSILTGPMVPSIFFSIAAGLLVDKFGIKRGVLSALIISSVGLAFRHLANNYVTMLTLMILSGFAPTFINANLSKIVGTWFPPEDIGKIVGILLAGGTGGMAVAMATTNLFSSVESAFITAAAFMIIVTVIWFFFMKNKPSHAEETGISSGSSQNILELLKLVAKSKSLWIAGVCLMLIMGCNITISGFIPIALTSVRGIDSSTAGLVGSVMMVGMLVSSLISPTIAQKIGLYRPYILVTAIIAAVIAYFGWQANGILLWISMFLFGFFLAAGMPIFMSLPMLLKEIGPKNAGSAGGLISTLQLIGAVVIPTYIITPIAGDNYYLMFGIAAIFTLLMGLISLLLPELGPKAQK